jgi:hypothetical protein
MPAGWHSSLEKVNVTRNEFAAILSEAGAPVNASFAATSREARFRGRLNDLSGPCLLADVLGAMIEPLRLIYGTANLLAQSRIAIDG